jgi:hypothetical protein
MVSTFKRLKKTFSSNKIDFGLNLRVTAPQHASDIEYLMYTIETLFWPFTDSYEWKFQRSSNTKILLSLNDSPERIVTLELKKVRDAFDRISGRKEVHLPRDFLQRIKEEQISKKSLTPELSEWALQKVATLIDNANVRNKFKHKLTIFLTHDVDRVNPYEPVGLLRRLLVPTRGVSNGFSARFKDFVQWLKNGDEFLNVYKTIMQKESDAGAIATYFFMSGPYSFRKIGARTGWCINNKRLHDILQLADHHHHRVGIHGCAYSLLKNDYARQRSEMSKTIGREVFWHRNHYLVWDPQKSPGALKEAGIKFDSSLGFNTAQGFRRGLAWPFEIWDMVGDQPSGVIEIPLVFMDSATFNESKNFVWKELDRQLDIVESVCGQVAVNFHLDYFVKNFNFIDGYAKFLESLKIRGADIRAEIDEDGFGRAIK